MVNSSPPNIQQHTEHLLHECKLNDKTLQKAQLKQHKIFQNFPTSPAPATPSAPPLPTGATPKASPLLEPNNSDNPFQCSCLENPRDGGAWRAAVYGVAQSRTRLKRLSSSSNNSDNDSPEMFFDTQPGVKCSSGQ